MTQAHRSELEDFTQALYGLAEMCQVKLTPFIVNIWIAAVRPHGFAEATRALVKAAGDAKPGRGFPSPNDVLTMMGHAPETDRSRAIAAADKIAAAVARYGVPCKREGFSVVREFVGELAWAVAHARGGWEPMLREVDGYGFNFDNWKTHLRDSALACIERARAGTLDLPPALPEATEQVKPDALPSVVTAALEVAMAPRSAGRNDACAKSATSAPASAPPRMNPRSFLGSST